MFGGGLSGSYSKSSGRSKTNYLMDAQKSGLRGLWSSFFAPYFSSRSGPGGGKEGERRGMGLPTYTGRLPGTQYGGVMSNLFRQAERFSGGGRGQPMKTKGGTVQNPEMGIMTKPGPGAEGAGMQHAAYGHPDVVGHPDVGQPVTMGTVQNNEIYGDPGQPYVEGAVDPNTGQRMEWQPGQKDLQQEGDLFSHYSYFANPEDRTRARMEAYQKMIGPERQKEDSMLKQKMANMGLSHSTDMLKAVSDLHETRGAQDTLMGLEMLDKYEQLGFEANEAALNRLTDIGTTQYEIVNKGLQSEFDEWLRTQPEYNPMIDKMLAYLGLQTKADTTTHGQSWNVKGSASYGSSG